jgi:hypothetical protein
MIWTKPKCAVEPVNDMHLLYMRLTSITEGLLHFAEADQRQTSEFTALLHALNELSHSSARVTVLLERIRMHDDKLYAVWKRAQEYEPEEAEDLETRTAP